MKWYWKVAIILSFLMSLPGLIALAKRIAARASAAAA